VYPFWTDVYIQTKHGTVIGEGIIIPGFNTKDEQVSPGGMSRKIFVKEVYGI
jgi:hypothetical protein